VSARTVYADDVPDLVHDEAVGLTFDAARAEVGGYVELVRLTDAIVMLVDEDGRMRGRPTNRAATVLANMLRPGIGSIVGDVVVLDGDDIDRTLGGAS